MTPRRFVRTARTAALLACGTAAVSSSAASAADGLGTATGLSAATQLDALSTGIVASSDFFAGRETNCAGITPLLASQTGYVIGGNFRDSGSNCYVWLNLSQSASLTGSQICTIALHEMGHLAGLRHVADSADVMYSPFNASAIPTPCAAPKPRPRPAARVKAKRRIARVCPPGTTNRDYCESVSTRRIAERARATR